MTEIFSWTWEDFRALPRLWWWDLERRWARFLLDHFGDAIAAEAALRRMAARAEELGARAYCPRHDRDWGDCPPECRDDGLGRG